MKIRCLRSTLNRVLAMRMLNLLDSGRSGNRCDIRNRKETVPLSGSRFWHIEFVMSELSGAEKE